MFTEPADLDRSEIADVLRARWGIEPASIEHAPVGFGSHHYDVDGRWFLTLDDLDDHGWFEDPVEGLRATFGAVAALRDGGLGFVLAAMRDRGGEILHRVCGHYSLVVFPFVEGASNPYGAHASDEQRRDVLRALGRLHAADVPDGLRRDPLRILKRAGLEEGLADLDGVWDAGPFGEPTRALIAEHADAVGRRLSAYDELDAAAPRDGWVATHGEPHGANVLQPHDGSELLLIDWDTAAVGPPERDLWMVEPRDAEDLDAYGGPPPNPDTLRLYRWWWDLTEVALYVTQFRRPHGDDADTRTAFENLQDYLTAIVADVSD